MRVLVTGASGYIGRAVVTALLDAGHVPIATRHRHPVDVPDGVEVRSAELFDPDSLRWALTDIDLVCHLAGLGRARDSLAHPLPYFRINVGGTVALLEAMADSPCRHLVFASTGAIYGAPERQPMDETTPDNPPHPYAASKLAAEWAIEAAAASGALGATIFRLFNVAGGADPDPTRLIPCTLDVAAGRAPHLAVNGPGTARRDYVHLTDIAAAFAAAASTPQPVGQSRRYNICSGAGTSIVDVIAAAERVTGRAVPVIHRPAAAEPPQLVGTSARALSELGWRAADSDLDTIIRDTWAARIGAEL